MSARTSLLDRTNVLDDVLWDLHSEATTALQTIGAAAGYNKEPREMRTAARNLKGALRNALALLVEMQARAGELEGLSRQWIRSEDDFYILVGTTHNRDSQYRHVKDTLLPRMRERHRGTFLFWIPDAFEGDLNWLKELLASILIQDRMNSESKEITQKGYDFLWHYNHKRKRQCSCYSNRYDYRDRKNSYLWKGTKRVYLHSALYPSIAEARPFVAGWRPCLS